MIYMGFYLWGYYYQFTSALGLHKRLICIKRKDSLKIAIKDTASTG